MLREAFTSSSFIDNHEFVNKSLTKYINDCSENWIGNRTFSPIGIVAQSSGYGKTRSLYEYAKQNVTVFICLRPKRTPYQPESYPNRSQLADYMEQAFETDKRKGKSFLAALLWSTLAELKSIEEQPNGQTLDQKSIATAFMKSQPWLDYSHAPNRVSLKFIDLFIR